MKSTDDENINGSKLVPEVLIETHSRDVYSFGAGDSTTPNSKPSKVRRVQRPTDLTSLGDVEVPADSKCSEPTPARTSFRFFSSDRRRSSVADSAAVRLLREFTGAGGVEKKALDKKNIFAHKKNNGALVAATPASVASKEAEKKYTLVPVVKPDANKLVIRISTAGQRMIGTTASSPLTPVMPEPPGKFKSTVTDIRKSRSTKIKIKGVPPLVVPIKNNCKGKSKGACSRSIDRLALTDRAHVIYTGIKKLAEGGSQVNAVRDPLLEATYRPSRRTVLELSTSASAANAKAPVVLNLGSLPVNPRQVKEPKESDVLIRQPTAERNENRSVCFNRKAEGTGTFIINYKSMSAKPLTGTVRMIGAQAVDDETKSEMKNISELVSNDTNSSNKDLLLSKSAEQPVGDTISDVIVPVRRELKSKIEECVPDPPSPYESPELKSAELKVEPLTINKISLSIKRALTGSWYVPEKSGKEKRKKRTRRRHEESVFDERAEDIRESPGRLGDDRPVLEAPQPLVHNGAIQTVSNADNVEPHRQTVNSSANTDPSCSLTLRESESIKQHRCSLIIEDDNYSVLERNDQPSDLSMNALKKKDLKMNDLEADDRPLPLVRSNLDVSIASAIADDAAQEKASTKLLTRKKARKCGSTNVTNDVSILPVVENSVENTTLASSSTNTRMKIKVECEKKSSVRLTPPWDTDFPLGMSSSTSIVSKFKDELKPADLALFDETKRRSLSFSDTESTLRPLASVRVSDDRKHSEYECRNLADCLSPVVTQKNFPGRSDLVMESASKKSIVACMDLSSKSFERSKLSSDIIKSVLNGKRKSPNIIDLDAVATKRSKVVTNLLDTCSLSEQTNQLFARSSDELNKHVSNKLNGVVGFPVSNESVTPVQERKRKSGVKAALSIDQTRQGVEQKLIINVKSLVNIQVNPIATKSSISTVNEKRQLSLFQDHQFPGDSADYRRVWCPQLLDGASSEHSTSIGAKFSKAGENGHRIPVETLSLSTEDVKSSDVRTTLSDNREAAQSDICTPIGYSLREISTLLGRDNSSAQAVPMTTNEPSNRKIRGDRTTVELKDKKSTVISREEYNMPLSSIATAAPQGQVSFAQFSTGSTKVLPVLDEPVLLNNSKSSRVSKLESRLLPEAPTSGAQSISDKRTTEVKEEGVPITWPKRKCRESKRLKIVEDCSAIRQVTTGDTITATPPLRLASMDETTDSVEMSLKIGRKKSHYSFFPDDDDIDDDDDDAVSSPISIRAFSPSSQSETKDEVISSPCINDESHLISDRQYCDGVEKETPESNHLKESVVRDDPTSVVSDIVPLEMSIEILQSKTTKSRKRKTSRLSAMLMTDVVRQNEPPRQLLSDPDIKVSAVSSQSEVSVSPSDSCVMTSLEALTPPPSACGVALDLSESCGILPTIFGEGLFPCEDDSFMCDKLTTSAGAILDVSAISEFLNNDQGSSRVPQEYVSSKDREEKEEDVEKNENKQHEELPFTSDLIGVDTAYMDIISSLSLGDATSFLDLSCASTGSVVTEVAHTNDSHESRKIPTESSAKKKSLICRPWSDSPNDVISKDMEEFEKQSKLFDNSSGGEHKSDLIGNGGAATDCEYDPLDFDSIIRNICNGTDEVSAATVTSENKLSYDEQMQLPSRNDKVDAYTGSVNVDLGLILSDDGSFKRKSYDDIEFIDAPLPLTFYPDVLTAMDASELIDLAALSMVDAKSDMSSNCQDSVPSSMMDVLGSNNSKVIEPEMTQFLRESAEVRKDDDSKVSKSCVGYLGAFTKFLQCSGPVASSPQRPLSSVDTENLRDAYETAISGCGDNRCSKAPPARRSLKKKTTQKFSESCCSSPLSVDLEESRLFTAASCNQVTRKNSRIFRRSTLLKQMCRFRQDTIGSGDIGSYDEDGTGTESDQTSSKSNRLQSTGGGARGKHRLSSKSGSRLERVKEEARHDFSSNLEIVATPSLTDISRKSVSIVGKTGKQVDDDRNSFVSVQLELAELESSVRSLFDVMFRGVGMGGFSIIPKIFSASVTESALSGVDQLLDAICMILAGDSLAPKTESNDVVESKSSSGPGGATSSMSVQLGDGNHLAMASDGVVMLCNRPRSCLARLKRKIATVLTLVLPDLALDAEELCREDEVIGELLRMVVSANSDSSPPQSLNSGSTEVGQGTFTSKRFEHSTRLAASKNFPPTSRPVASDSLNTAAVRLDPAANPVARKQLNVSESFEHRLLSLATGCHKTTRDTERSNKSRKKRMSKKYVRIPCIVHTQFCSRYDRHYIDMSHYINMCLILLTFNPVVH